MFTWLIQRRIFSTLSFLLLFLASTNTFNVTIWRRSSSEVDRGRGYTDSQHPSQQQARCNGHNKHAPLLNCHKFALSHFRHFPHQISQRLFTLPELARRCYFRAVNSKQGTAISSLFEAVHRLNGRTSRGHKPSNTCLHLIHPVSQGRAGQVRSIMMSLSLRALS